MKLTRTPKKTYVIKFLNGDVRECRKIGNYYVHVLNTNYHVFAGDPRIAKVIPVLGT